MQVKKMECDICKVQTEEGNCVLHSVKVRAGLTTACVKQSANRETIGLYSSLAFPGSPD